MYPEQIGIIMASKIGGHYFFILWSNLTDYDQFCCLEKSVITGISVLVPL